MLRYFKLIGMFLRLGILGELEYRANFFVQIFQSMMGLIVSLGGIAVIFDHTANLNGWRQSELLAIVGVYFLVGAVVYTVIHPSLQRFMEDVRQGTLDFTLIKPVDAQVMVSFRQFQIWKFFDFLLGLAILAYAVIQLGVAIGFEQALSFVVALISGGVIVYSFYMILATIVFWFIKVDNILVIFGSMYEAGRWPVGIYPVWLRLMLTFFVPIAFAVTVPAEALTARLTTSTLIGSVALACGLLFVSRRFWKFGVKNYTGASA